MNIFVIILLCASVLCEEEGETYTEGDLCVDNKGSAGNCTLLQDCKQAVLDIKFNVQPKYCKTQPSESLVCCNIDSFEALSRLENLDDCQFRYGRRCEKTQRKSHDACVEYQEMVCPTPKPQEKVPPPPDPSSEEPAISEGVDSVEGQFPYMALLGYGNDSSIATWQCGGSIISNKYILTAGHCTAGPGIGPVAFAVVGTLRRSDPVKEGRLYKVKKIIKHPDYRPPHKYNDIALLEIETPITFDELVQPACLYSELDQEDVLATIIGWGATVYKGEGADVLQNAEVYKFTDEECSKLYPPGRLLKKGFNATTQLCYGHYQEDKDACQGDSGGPMQSFNHNFPCLRVVVGVTSFGKSCGHAGIPGIYTRVSAFLPWIESVVWP